MSFHQYDTQLYIGTNSLTLTTQTASIESCTQRVHNWLLNNGLHLKPFNPRSKRLAALAESIGTVSVAGSPIKHHHLKIWVFTLTQKCSLISRCLKHVRSVFFHIRALRHIRASLTNEASKTIAAAIVGSRFDYCNSLLAGTFISNLTRPSAYPECSCSSGRTKTSVLPHHTCSF